MRIYERLTPLNARERRFAEKHHALLTTYISAIIWIQENFMMSVFSAT